MRQHVAAASQATTSSTAITAPRKFRTFAARLAPDQGMPFAAIESARTRAPVNMPEFLAAAEATAG